MEPVSEDPSGKLQSNRESYLFTESTECESGNAATGPLSSASLFMKKGSIWGWRFGAGNRSRQHPQSPAQGHRLQRGHV